MLACHLLDIFCYLDMPCDAKARKLRLLVALLVAVRLVQVIVLSSKRSHKLLSPLFILV